jgi:hypothetical protein
MSAIYEQQVQGSLTQTLMASPILEETGISELDLRELDLQASASHQSNLEIDLLLQSIESRATRQAVQFVLGDLLRLQDCLRLFESHLCRNDQAIETLAMFELFHAEARFVINDIRSLAIHSSGIDDRLMESMDGIAFAIGHDLHRVFECQLSGLNEQTSPELLMGELIHSHGLLTNCIQEVIVTLAQQFDPTITGSRLFEDSKARLSESLMLSRDLTDLIEFVGRWKDANGQLAATSVVERVIKFRRCSMPLLMYRDWKEYEKFSAKIVLASTDPEALGPVLHSFGCYLETLRTLVSSRSVLTRAVVETSPSESEFGPLELDAQWPVTNSASPAVLSCV